MEYTNSLDFARELDQADPLASYRNEFLFPQHKGKDAIYFCGNSLGLQPKAAQSAIQQELDDWAKFGVEAHFEAKNPWFSYHEAFSPLLARLTGANEKEVVAMNGLTVNLHLLLVSFYQPKGKRNKILFEANAFPSDRYALASQIKFHGLNPNECLVEMKPKEGEYNISTQAIENKINELGDELALVMFGGVNYYTGQAFQMDKITKAAHQVGAFCGFDLAHGMGNLKLKLHDWNVDFACWCSYKYLNSGPGSVSGIFVHNKHGSNPDLPRFSGWWGNDPDTRFLMEDKFVPAQGAAAWQLSNAPVFAMAAHKASLDMFDKAGIDNLRAKSEKLTGFLEFIINEINTKSGNPIQIITPAEKDERGCQLSLIIKKGGKKIHEALTDKGVVSDWRNPDVLRIAPVPLYNSFEDVGVFGNLLAQEVGA